ncbi:MAG TPA: MFS transporter [Candidatus Krumholzibacteria bacterium]|nr:MFS transporter [Candidatus Krumholzibacteria bacterium]
MALPLLRALSHRNYRLFFYGQGLSLIGTWITRVATSWLVYRLTGSALLLGVVNFAGQVPNLIFSPLGGVLADRWNLRRVLVVTQVLSMVQSFVLAALTLTKVITVPQLIVLNTLQGIVNAFDTPARQAFAVQMVEGPADLPNAIAINSMMFNSARLVGPMVAGLLIAAASEGVCFAIDGVSYIAVIVSLLAMHISPLPRRTQHAPLWSGIREGFSYAMGFEPIRGLLVLVATASLLGLPYAVLLPVIAREVLHGGAHTYGFLASASGLGALAGAVYLASRRSVRGLGRVIAISGLLFGAALMAFAFCRSLVPALAALFVVGFGMMAQNASANTILQTIVHDDKRGRIMSFYAAAILGVAPLGSLLAGAVAARVGAPYTVLGGGCACILATLFFIRRLPVIRRLVRPIYEQKGIIPEVARGMQSTNT